MVSRDSGVNNVRRQWCQEIVMLQDSGVKRQWCYKTLVSRDSGVNNVVIRQWCQETVMLTMSEDSDVNNDVKRQWCQETVVPRDSDVNRQWCQKTVVLRDIAFSITHSPSFHWVTEDAQPLWNNSPAAEITMRQSHEDGGQQVHSAVAPSPPPPPPRLAKSTFAQLCHTADYRLTAVVFTASICWLY